MLSEKLKFFWNEIQFFYVKMIKTAASVIEKKVNFLLAYWWELFTLRDSSID